MSDKKTQKTPEEVSVRKEGRQSSTKQKTPNVQIPLTLFKKIIEVLECWDVSRYDCVIQDEYRDILSALRAKQDNIDLRDAYAKILHAQDDDQRHAARMIYLQQKRLNKDHPY